MTDEPPAHCTDWQGEDWTPEPGHPGRPPQRPLHRPGRPGPGHRPRVGGPRGRAHLGHPLRRPAGLGGPAGLPVLRLGSTACSSARSWPRRPPPPPPARSATCAATPSPCCPFCGYNMADYFAHWLRIGAAADPRQAAQDLLRQLVPQGRRRQVAVARLRRELAGARVGLRAGGGRGEAVETPIGYVPAPGAIDIDGLDVSKEDMDELLRVDRDEWRDEVPLIREHFAQFGDRLPAELTQRRRRPRAPAGLRSAGASTATVLDRAAHRGWSGARPAGRAAPAVGAPGGW